MSYVNMRYVIGAAPKEIPAGQILAHNHINHGKKTPIGRNGFRAWFQDEPAENQEPCDCGWADLPHYRRKERAEIE